MDRPDTAPSLSTLPAARVQVEPPRAVGGVALAAYGAGFASAALVAACVAFAACLLAFGLISGEETAPPSVPTPAEMPCKFIDCRDPL